MSPHGKMNSSFSSYRPEIESYGCPFRISDFTFLLTSSESETSGRILLPTASPSQTTAALKANTPLCSHNFSEPIKWDIGSLADRLAFFLGLRSSTATLNHLSLSANWDLP
jgi:hypothetical protein